MTPKLKNKNVPRNSNEFPYFPLGMFGDGRSAFRAMAGKVQGSLEDLVEARRLAVGAAAVAALAVVAARRVAARLAAERRLAVRQHAQLRQQPGGPHLVGGDLPRALGSGWHGRWRQLRRWSRRGGLAFTYGEGDHAGRSRDGTRPTARTLSDPIRRTGRNHKQVKKIEKKQKEANQTRGLGTLGLAPPGGPKN